MGLELGCSELVSVVTSCTWHYESLPISAKGFFKLRMQTPINKFSLRVKSKVVLAMRLQESRDCASAVTFLLPLGSGCVGDWGRNQPSYLQRIYFKADFKKSSIVGFA